VCVYSGVYRDVIGGITGDVMCRCPGDDEAVRGGAAERAGERQLLPADNHVDDDEQCGQQRRRPTAAGHDVVAAAGGSSVGRLQRHAVPDDSADPADAAERDAGVAGFRVRLADAGVDVRPVVVEQSHRD